MSLKRQTFQIVEVDYDRCTRTYGSAPCTAALGTTGERKCFNTFATCQDQANYEQGTYTVRYCKNQAGIPKGEGLLPFLQSVSTSPAEISLGAPDENIGTLGKRASVTIKLKGGTQGDWLVDPYYSERISGAAQADGIGYNPDAIGSHFPKMRARQVYFQNRRVRVKNGEVGDTIASIPSREYILTGWADDINNNTTLQAKDIIDLTDDRKSLYPAPSEGRIVGDIADSGLPSFDLTPSGVGADYAASGYATIGNEIVGYTISGDTVTLTERAALTTEAEAHSDGDTFQTCGVFQDVLLEDAAETLFLAAQGVTSDDLDTTQWATERLDTLAGLRLTRVVPKPTGVKTLLSELCALGLTFYLDDLSGKVKLYVNRPLSYDETSTALSDDVSVIEGTLSRRDLSDQITTQVAYFHGVRRWTDDLSKSENYDRAFINIDSDLRSTDALGQDRIKQFFQPWFGTVGNDPFARAISTRYATRYAEPQERVSFVADYKDLASLELTSVIDLTTRAMTDVTGAAEARQVQVVAREDVDPGHRIAVTVQTYQLEGRWGYLMTSTDTSDYDSATDAEKAKGCYMIDETDPDYPEFDDGTTPYLVY